MNEYDLEKRAKKEQIKKNIISKKEMKIKVDVNRVFIGKK